MYRSDIENLVPACVVDAVISKYHHAPMMRTIPAKLIGFIVVCPGKRPPALERARLLDPQVSKLIHRAQSNSFIC